MQMVKKVVIILLLFWGIVLFFMPKEEIYFLLEKELAKNDIVLNEGERNEGLFSLTLKDVTVYVKGIPLVTVKEIEVFTLLFYTDIAFESLMIDESLKAMTPTEIEKLHLVHRPWMPLDIGIDALGPFGEATGKVDIYKRSLYMEFNDTKKLGMLSSKLKRGEKGWYYETSF